MALQRLNGSNQHKCHGYATIMATRCAIENITVEETSYFELHYEVSANNQIIAQLKS